MRQRSENSQQIKPTKYGPGRGNFVLLGLGWSGILLSNERKWTDVTEKSVSCR